jgi:hypothetical protein
LRQIVLDRVGHRHQLAVVGGSALRHVLGDDDLRLSIDAAACAL